MKKFFYFIFLMLVLLFCSIYYFKIHVKSEIPEITLYKSFESCGANVVNSEIYFWADLDSSYKNLEDIKLLTGNISNDLGIVNDEAYSKTINENDNVQGIEISGNDKNKSHVSIRAQLLKGKKEAERSISISITDGLAVKSLLDKRVKVIKVLDKFNIKPRVNSCVTGNFSGKLTDEQMNKVCQNIFAATHAKKVEGIRNENLISVSAYTPLIDDSIKVNKKNVNLNLAVRYNSYEDKTYIWLATPVISIEY
jgi:hypothetical protein